MKKLLIGTTALLAAGAFVSSAQASEPVKLTLGGYMEYWMAAADQDGDFVGSVNSFDIQGESEVFFKGTTTLDNGLKVGVQIELEGGSNYNGTDIIDESYLWVEGAFGKVIVGSENDVGYLSTINAPEASDIGNGFDEGDTDKYVLIPVTFLNPQFSTETGDANKISYFTPKFYGLQAGVSYVPSNTTTGDDSATSAASETIAKANAAWDEAWAFALSYSGSFSGVGVKAAANYTVLDTPADAAATYGAGLNLSYMGFTVGGAYRVMDSDDAGALTTVDGKAWDLGIQYAEGPYAVSLSYTRSDVEGGAAAANDEIDLWRIGAKYALGPGVNLFGQVAYLNAEDESGLATAGNEGAWGGVVGLKLVF